MDTCNNPLCDNENDRESIYCCGNCNAEASYYKRVTLARAIKVFKRAFKKGYPDSSDELKEMFLQVFKESRRTRAEVVASAVCYVHALNNGSRLTRSDLGDYIYSYPSNPRPKVFHRILGKVRKMFPVDPSGIGSSCKVIVCNPMNRLISEQVKLVKSKSIPGVGSRSFFDEILERSMWIKRAILVKKSCQIVPVKTKATAVVYIACRLVGKERGLKRSNTLFEFLVDSETVKYQVREIKKDLGLTLERVHHEHRRREKKTKPVDKEKKDKPPKQVNSRKKKKKRPSKPVPPHDRDCAPRDCPLERFPTIDDNHRAPIGYVAFPVKHCIHFSGTTCGYPVKYK